MEINSTIATRENFQINDSKAALRRNKVEIQKLFNC